MPHRFRTQISRSRCAFERSPGRAASAICSTCDTVGRSAIIFSAAAPCSPRSSLNNTSHSSENISPKLPAETKDHNVFPPGACYTDGIFDEFGKFGRPDETRIRQHGVECIVLERIIEKSISAFTAVALSRAIVKILRSRRWQRRRSCPYLFSQSERVTAGACVDVEEIRLLCRNSDCLSTRSVNRFVHSSSM